MPFSGGLGSVLSSTEFVFSKENLSLIAGAVYGWLELLAFLNAIFEVLAPVYVGLVSSSSSPHGALLPACCLSFSVLILPFKAFVDLS